MLCERTIRLWNYSESIYPQTEQFWYYVISKKVPCFFSKIVSTQQDTNTQHTKRQTKNICEHKKHDGFGVA